MCIPFPGRVVDVDAEGATVSTDGRTRRATTLIVPDVAVGDWVIVGSGAVLRRLDPADAVDLISLITTARTGTHRTEVTR
jgi:hydrogenase assembly chaperone HypC/HupF